VRLPAPPVSGTSTSTTGRHHGATMALNKGFTAPIVMALGGWKTERMMRRYAAVTDATLRRAAEAVSGAEAPQAVMLV
jgi:hypothetical protein